MDRDAGRKVAGRLLLAVGLVAGVAVPATAEEPLSVTYGAAALTAEGDKDYREIIYLSVPDTTTERLYLRVFDPDLGGAHDTLYGAGWDGQVRYALFGGKGAAEPAPAPSTAKPPRRDTARAEIEPPVVLGGERLAEVIVGESAGSDDGWRTLASVRPDQGDHVHGRYVFRLEVTGLSGNDGNTFTATLSTRDRRDAPPEGLEIVDFVPTVRVLDNRRVTEIAIDIPADAKRIVVSNFDMAAGQLTFESTWRSVPLAASGQDEWRQSTVELLPEERGTTASIVAARGQELPNDLTLSVTDGDGRLLPSRLPAVAALPNARPVPVVDYTPLADCTALAFDASRSGDPEGEPLRYLWEFGDGASGDGVAVVHRYPGPGTYSGVLRVQDSSPLIGNGAALPFQVTVKRPPKAVAGPDMVMAPGETVSFDGSASTPGDRPIATYNWDFQDGARGNGPSPSHAFAHSGRYVVTLRVQDDRPGACDSSSDQLVVDVNAAPVAVAGPDRHVAVGETVELTGAQSYDMDGKITAWAWDLGDGTGAEGGNVAHAYTAPGTYLVTLTIRDDAGLANSTASSTARVIVNDPPAAEAGADRTAAIGEPLTFDAAGSVDRDGKLVRHEWDFGDGSAGSGSRVQYAYGRPGNYQVTLTVTDDSDSSTSTASDQANVIVNAPPVARAGEDQIVTSSEVRFDASASEDPDGSIARFAWDFGDGTTGEGVAPAHVYRQPGDYRVRLTVTDDSGTVRNTAVDEVRVLVNQAPIADAGRDQLGAPGQELEFSGSGSLDPDGDVAEYSWAFKDGSTAGGERVTHRFDQPGTYHVRLTVRDDTGQPDAIDFDEAEVVINAPPVAEAGADQLAAPGDRVVLDAGNSFDRDGSIASYRWEFSDRAAPATDRVAARTYPEPGVYGARLTVTDGSGAINAVDQDEAAIRINHAPVASAGRDVFTSSNVVSFDGSASADADGDALVYSWDFGDGTTAGGAKVTHTYAEGGTYPVVLTVDDGTGVRNAKAVAAVTVKIDRPPVADAGGNREVCAGDVVVLDGSRSKDPEGGVLRYSWDFGDGTMAEVVNPTKTYLRGGAYPVTLAVEDDSGFPANRHTDRVLVRVAESPIAVAGPEQLACAGSEVHFDGSASRDSDGVVNRFTWDFGDGGTGGGERPVHVFATPGDYRVVLTIEGDAIGQCANTNSAETVVEVVEAPLARIAAPARVGVGAPATFDASGSTTAAGKIVGWQWDFGDGAKAEGPKVEHVFDKPGGRIVTLTLRTEGGVDACKEVTAQHSITVNAPPVADAGADRAVAIDEEVLFDAARSHDPDGGIVAYAWDFGDGSTASGINARHSYRESGRYDVKLTVTDDLGLPNSRVTDTAAVTVNRPPTPVIAAPPAACPDEQLAFSARDSSDADGKIETFAWGFGDGTTASGPDVTHIYRTPGLYELTLAVDDGTGLGNARKQTAIPFRVNRQPRAEAGPDRVVCPGQELTFDGSASVDWDGGGPLAYRWDFRDGASAEDAQVAHRYAEPGEYDVRLTVTDDSGSRCASASDVARVRVNAPPVVQVDGDREGFVGGAHDQLQFDASASVDGDGHPLSYLWDLGDGVVLAGDKVRHSYAKPGTYPVRLTVSDSSGLACGRTSEVVEVSVRTRG